MSPQLKALIRKEWRQQRKYFWVTLILLLGFLVIDAPFDDWFATVPLMFGIAFIAGVVATNVISSEHTTSSFSFYETLPISRRTKTLIKFSMGGLVTVVPFLITYAIYLIALLFLDVNGELPEFFYTYFTRHLPFARHFSTIVLISAITCCLVGVHFYLWTATLAIRQTSFIRAGSIAVGILCLCLIYLFSSWEIMRFVRAHSSLSIAASQLWFLGLNAFNPLLPVMLLEFADDFHKWPQFATVVLLMSSALFQFGIPILLARRILNQYGKEPGEIKQDVLARTIVRVHNWWEKRQEVKRNRRPYLLSGEPSSFFSQLVRQQWRSHKWLYCLMACSGFLIGPAIALIAVGVNHYIEDLHDIADEMEELLMMLVLCVGLPAMTYLGTTSLLNDRSREIQSFWRSLPVSPSRFITTRFFVTFAFGLLCLLGPALVLLPAVKLSSVEFSYLPFTVFLRGTCYLFAHYALAAALLWALGNPVHSIVGMACYSGIVHSLITSFGSGFREPFAADQLLMDPSVSIAMAFWLLTAVLAIPSVVLLGWQMSRQRLTAW
ncbi:MAG: hypothetical protein CMJ46_12955 [Planctomyces sp.]|nr:hypothetical protein [Planctomyces sp.]